MFQCFPTQPHSFVKANNSNIGLESNGYVILDFLTIVQLNQLRDLFNQYHSIKKPGFFFSIFNNDQKYREKVTQVSENIVKSSLAKHFSNYKIGYSGFVVRGPNDDGEFFMHQDPSFVDETKFSPLHVWCPLYDITLDFAPVCVVPSSHKLAYRYRANSIPAPFESIREDVRKYLQPLVVKAGEVIFLDPRLIHSSLPNKKEIARPVLLVQVFPKEAPYETPYLRGKQLELYSLPEDYFIKNSNFYENVDAPPALGNLKSISKMELEEITLEQFKNFCAENNLQQTEIHAEPFKAANALTEI